MPLEPAHYQRHQDLLPLEAVQDKHVLLVGCGSLGTLIARILARLGVLRFHLIDPAAVTPLHLNRAAFSEDQIGHNKAAALSSVLTRIHKRVRCITTAKPFDADHLTRGRDDAIVITTSDPRLPPKIIGAMDDWPKPERPAVLVTRYADLTGGYWLADLAHDNEVHWPSDLPWLSLREPPEPEKESRIATTAHFAAAIATQALVDHLAAPHATGASKNVRRNVEFNLGSIVHEAQ